MKRRAFWVLAGVGYREDAGPYFKKFGILTLPSQYIYESLLYVRQNMNNFETVQDLHSHDTRTHMDLRIEFLRLRKSWNATLHYAPSFFNKLPVGSRKLPIKQFKAVIKKYLINKTFYCFNDFLNGNVSDQEFY